MTRELVLKLLLKVFFKNNRLKSIRARRKHPDYQKIMNEVDNCTKFLGDVSENEKLYCFINDINKHNMICGVCNELKLKFGRFSYGYARTCGQEKCKEKNNKNFFNVVQNNGLTRHQNITKRMVESGRRHEVANKSAKTMKKVLDNGMTRYQMNVQKTFVVKSNKIDEQGRNSFTLASLKTAEIMMSTICDNGKTKKQNAIEKSQRVKLSKIDQFGRNVNQLTALKTAQTKKTTICSNGKTILENQVEKRKQTLKTICENGLTVSKNAAIKCQQTLISKAKEGQFKVKSSICRFENSFVVYQGSAEKYFLDFLKSIQVISKVERAKRILYKHDDGSLHNYFPDYELDNKVFEVKTKYTYDRDNKALDLRRKNNLKFKATLQKNKKFYLVWVKNRSLYIQQVFLRDLENIDVDLFQVDKLVNLDVSSFPL